MSTFKKILFIATTLLSFQFVTEAKNIDSELSDLVYETIKSKKVVFYSNSETLYLELKGRAEQTGSDTLFIDEEIFNSDSFEFPFGIYEQFELIKKIGDPKLYLISLADPSSLVYQFIEKYEADSTNPIAFSTTFNKLCIGEYIPTVEGIHFLPLKRSELTQKTLQESIKQFQVFANKYDETIIAYKDNDDIELSKFNNEIKTKLSICANILAWNAILLEDYETAATLYLKSIYYDNDNILSKLSLASLIKENKISNSNKAIAESGLHTASSINNSLFDIGAILAFSYGYVYGAKYFLQNDWEWLMFAIPINSEEYQKCLKNCSENATNFISALNIRSSTIPSKQILKKLDKFNLPQKLSQYTISNYFTFYSILKNCTDKPIGKTCFIDDMLSNYNLPNIYIHRYRIEKSIIENDLAELTILSDEYLTKYGYNKQVVIARLLALNRDNKYFEQINFLEMLIEHDKKSCKWAEHLKKGFNALLMEDDIKAFTSHCYTALNEYKGHDAITLGYLHNTYTFAYFLDKSMTSEVNNIKSPLNIPEDIIIKKLYEADFLMYALGTNFIGKRDYEKAEFYLRMACLKNLFSVEYRNNLSVALAENENYEAGKEILERFVEILDYYALDTLAVCTLRSDPNNAQEALEYLQKAEIKFFVSSNDDPPVEILLHYAEIYYALDQKEKAKEYLNKVLVSANLDSLINSDKEVLEQLKKALK